MSAIAQTVMRRSLNKERRIFMSSDFRNGFPQGLLSNLTFRGLKLIHSIVAPGIRCGSTGGICAVCEEIHSDRVITRP